MNLDQPRRQIPGRAPIALCVLMMLGSSVALADDKCVDFKWDASREHALFAGTPETLKAGADFKSAPTIEANKLYALQLLPQGQVTFMTAPRKDNTTVGANAGLASLRIAVPGNYRVSIDAPFWIDVVADGGAVEGDRLSRSAQLRRAA